MSLSLALAASLAFLPMQAPAALTAIRAEGPKRLEVWYEASAPTMLMGRQKSLTATLIADIGPQTFAARATVKSAGVADWFRDYALDVQSNGSVLEAGGVIPRRFDSFNKDGRKNRYVNVDFLPQEVRTQASPAFSNLGPPASEDQKLEALDPLAALVSLSLGATATATNPCGGPLKIFDGRQRYDIRLSYTRRFAIKSPAWKGPAILCKAEYVPLAGFPPYKMGKVDTPDLEWLNITLADMPSGLTPLIRIEGRSQRRGKVTVEATRLSYGPAPASSTVKKP